MKKLLLISFFFAFSLKINAQKDQVTLRTGETLTVKIAEVTPSQIKFLKTLDGPVYSMNKSEVFMILYEGGRKQLFEQENISNIKNQNAKIEDEVLDPSKRYGGPRIGLTYLSEGFISDKVGAQFISQFGWQFETRLFKLADGSGALFEVIPVIGGLDRGKFLPSISTVLGYRLANGIEFGIGPNLSLSGVGLVYAIGFSFKSGAVTFPINLVFAPSSRNRYYEEFKYDNNGTLIPSGEYEKNGSRLSLLIGFNSRKM
jgi:hypothetical protein